jgi:hypothetical protein
MITAEHFTRRMGTPPVQDDLERSNCAQAGQPGHTQCGWDEEFDLPVFVVGAEPLQREHFRNSLWTEYDR